MNGSNGEQHLTVAELAERYRVPLGTVYRWNSHGTGPRPIKVGKHRRYRLSEVEAWEARRGATFVDPERDEPQLDSPIGSYRKGYEDGYEAGKQAAMTGAWAKGYQDAFRYLRRRIEDSLKVWADEPVPVVDGAA